MTFEKVFPKNGSRRSVKGKTRDVLHAANRVSADKQSREPENTCASASDVLYYHLRRCGETGRRAGLKILWSKIRVGSSPTTGTNEQIRPPAPTSKNSPFGGCFSFASTSHTAGVQMWEQTKKRRCVARLFLRVPNGGIAHRAIPPGYPPYPAIRRLHIAHRRRADVGANEKEAVRSTAVFASAERGHRAPRDTTGTYPPYSAMSDRNNINDIRK